MTRFGRGHIPDHDRDVARDLRERPAHALVGATPAAQNVDYTAFMGAIFDQGATSSCVGNASSKSLGTRAAIEGKKLPVISRKAIYDVARLIDGPYQQLSDDGSRPAAAYLGMREYGVVSEERWPLLEERVNDAPPFDVFLHGLEGLLPDYYRIAAGGGCAQLIRRALAQGYCPTFAMPVDDAYESYDGSAVFDRLQGPSLGGHYQCVVGCVTGAILVAGSWGTGWGLRGLARIADAFFDSSAVTDIFVPTTSPREVS